MNRNELPPRQLEFLEAVERLSRFRVPTIRELMDEMNVASPQGIQTHFDALYRKRFLIRVANGKYTRYEFPADSKFGILLSLAALPEEQIRRIAAECLGSLSSGEEKGGEESRQEGKGV